MDREECLVLPQLLRGVWLPLIILAVVIADAAVGVVVVAVVVDEQFFGTSRNKPVKKHLELAGSCRVTGTLVLERDLYAHESF